MRDFDAFVGGHGRLAGLLRALPPFEPPPAMEARFLAALPATPGADGQFEPPPSLAETVLAEAARLDTAQRPRQQAVLDELARAGAEQAFGSGLSAASRDWLDRRGAQQPPRAARARRRFHFAPLGGALAAAVALGVALQILREQPAEQAMPAPVASEAAGLPAAPPPAPASSAEPVPALPPSIAPSPARPTPEPAMRTMPPPAQPAARAERKATLSAPARVHRIQAEQTSPATPAPRLAGRMARQSAPADIATAAEAPAAALADRAMEAAPPLAEAPALLRPQPGARADTETRSAGLAPKAMPPSAPAAVMSKGAPSPGAAASGIRAPASFPLTADPAAIARRLPPLSGSQDRWRMTASAGDLDRARDLGRRLESALDAAGRKAVVEVAAGKVPTGQVIVTRLERDRAEGEVLP